uniref:Uncharacterized protein n=1 Tax=Arundo donax TaxID=35708 RepID=A0A0A8ZWD8_ARUDO
MGFGLSKLDKLHAWTEVTELTHATLSLCYCKGPICGCYAVLRCVVESNLL